jgi:EmrB/QacA subfamily drug resistance transporter
MPSKTLTQSRPLVPANRPEGESGTVRNLRGSTSVFLFVILAAQLMVVLDTTIVNIALPSMQRALGFSSTSLSWVLNAYILTFGGLLLLGARAGDLLGRRRVFLTGIALFTLSSLAGGLAAAGWMLLAARALQGVGAALAAPSALSLLTATFAEGPARVRAIALYTTVSAAGGAIGLVAGGLLTDLASWRWVMFVNVPIGAIVWLVGRKILVETPRRHGRFDLAGALASTLGMGAVVLGLVEAGSVGWTAPLTIVSFVAGVGLLGYFVYHEARVEEPILPLRLLAHATRNTANVARGLVYAGMYAMFFFVSQFLQDVKHFTPIAAGLAFLPMPASVFLSSQLTSRVLVRRFSLRAITVVGIALASTGLLLASQLLSPGVSYAQIALWLVLVGAGMGTAFVTLTTASLHAVDPADIGAASGLVNVSQQLGGAVGLAILVSVFGVVTDHLQLGAPAASEAAHLRMPDAVSGGLHDVFSLALVFMLVAMGLVWVGIGRSVTTTSGTRIGEADDEGRERVAVAVAGGE